MPNAALTQLQNILQMKGKVLRILVLSVLYDISMKLNNDLLHIGPCMILLILWMSNCKAAKKVVTQYFASLSMGCEINGIIAKNGLSISI